MHNALIVASAIRTAVALPRRSHEASDELAPSDPAARALTDFALQQPVTIDADCRVEEALADMVRFGVRALLVTRDTDAGEAPLAGLVTSYDLQGGGRPRNSRAAAQRRCELVRVRDFMTPWEDLSVLDYDALRAMTAAELYETFQGTGLTHVLVVESNGPAMAIVRGLVSRAELTRRLQRAASTTLS